MAVAAAALAALPLMGDITLGLTRPLQAVSGDCRVLRVVDGDTADLWCSGGEAGQAVQGQGVQGQVRLRLTGYDSPELFSPGCAGELRAALAAKWALRRLIWEAEVLEIRFEGTDRYDRRLGRVVVDGRDIAGAMVDGGHGRAYQGGQRQGWCS